MTQISWTEALATKPAIKSAIQDIVDQIPTAGGGRDMFESCLNTLASYTDPDIELKAEKFDALIDNGVEDWSGYEDAMDEFEGPDDPEDDSEDDEDADED